MPKSKRTAEGGGGGGKNNNKKKQQAGFERYGNTYIKAGRWDEYKGVLVLMSDSIYGKKIPENVKGMSFLYSVDNVSVSDDDDDNPRFVLKYEKKAVEGAPHYNGG